MEMNILEALKERRNFNRNKASARIHLERRKLNRSCSATLKNIGPGGLSCISSVVLHVGEELNVRIPHTGGIFEAEAMVISARQILGRCEVELRFTRVRRDIPVL